MKKDKRARMMKAKWKALKARGITPPANHIENAKRAFEAHHGEGTWQDSMA